MVSAFIFGKTVCWKGIEYLVHKTDPNAKIQAAQITFGKKGLCLHKLSLDGIFGHIDVEKMHLGLRLHLKKMAIQPIATFDHPVWDVPESLGAGAGKRSIPTAHIEVLDGKLRRGEHTLSVNFTSGQSKADLGLIDLADGAIEVMLKMLPEGLVAISRFHHADLEELSPFGDLFPTSWIPEQGQVAGHLTAQWDSEGQLSEVGGDIQACDLKLWHPQRKLQFGAKNLDWKGDFPKGTLQVEDGYLLALSKRLPAQWGLRLSGGVEKGKIALTGCMVREGEVFPIAIAGQGKIGKDTSLQATFHVSGEGQSTISVTMKPHASVLRGRFQEISSKQLLLFRDGLGAFFPVFRDLELEGAKLNAELIAYMQKGAIKRVEIENISSETMWLKWPSHQIEGKGKNLKLSGTLPFEKGPLWKKAVWNVAMDQGQIQDFEDVSIRFFVEGENIQHGMASCKWHALEVEGEINGTLLHPQIALNAWGTTQKIAKILGVEPKGDQPLTLRALIDRKNTAWNAVGNLKAGEGELTFGTIFELKKQIPRGWVEGENISPAVYDLAIKALEMPFTIDGNIDLSGTVDPASYQISIDSELLHYTSNDLDIEFPHLGKPSPLPSESAQHAILSYQAKTKNWEIVVPLFGAKLKDKTYGFEVENMEGLAILNGRRLTSQNLKAKVHGLDLCLDLSLEIKEPGKADLHISATEMAGDIAGLMDVLRHFDKFKSLKLPLTGQIQNIDNGPFSLFSPLGQPEKKTAYSAHLKLIDGSYAVTDHFVGNALSCEMKFTSDDEILEIHALDGDLLLTDGDHQSHFEINAPDLRLIDMDHGDWEFDLRIESQTHDLMRLSGALDHTHGLKLDETKSHLFGEKLYIEQFKLEPFAFQGRTVLKLQKIDTALRFLKALALVDVHATTIGAIQKTDLKGDLSLNLTYHDGEFNIESDGRDLKVKHWCIPRFSLKMAHEGHLLSLDHLMIGDFQARALAEKRATQWDLSLFEIDWKNTQLQTFEGHFTDDALTLIVNSAQIDLDHLRPLFFEEKNPYFQGLFDLTGNVTLNISNWDIEGQFQLFSDNFTSANIELKTLAPFEFSFNRKTGVALSGALLDLAGSEIEIEHLGYDKTIAQWFCHGMALSIAPEMVYFLAEKELIPYLEKHKEQLFIRGIPIRWDNHLETTLELCYSPKSFSLSAILKDGYYW
ncbi:MAG TPA: hypothetical protein PLO43_01670, partial [Chlamydiales bacterium]|nr:hypothetical protein [Chlamydiales bacterium]